MINFLSQLILVLLVGIKIPNKVFTLNRILAHLKYNNNYHFKCLIYSRFIKY